MSSFTSQKNESTHTHSHMHTPNLCLYVNVFVFSVPICNTSSVPEHCTFFIYAQDPSKQNSFKHLSASEEKWQWEKAKQILPYLYENFTEACFVTWCYSENRWYLKLGFEAGLPSASTDNQTFPFCTSLPTAPSCKTFPCLSSRQITIAGLKSFVF